MRSPGLVSIEVIVSSIVARRKLFVASPGYGHVQPMLPSARACQAVGHELLWATAPGLSHPGHRVRRPGSASRRDHGDRCAQSSARGHGRPQRGSDDDPGSVGHTCGSSGTSPRRSCSSIAPRWYPTRAQAYFWPRSQLACRRCACLKRRISSATPLVARRLVPGSILGQLAVGARVSARQSLVSLKTNRLDERRPWSAKK